MTALCLADGPMSRCFHPTTRSLVIHIDLCGQSFEIDVSCEVQDNGADIRFDLDITNCPSPSIHSVHNEADSLDY